MRNRSSVKWFLGGFLLCVSTLFALTMTAGEQAEKAAGAVDPDAYKEFMAGEVTDIYDLEAYFIEQRSSFLPILPPDPDVVLKQSGVPMGMSEMSQCAY